VTDYRATTTEISLHPVEMDPLSHGAIRVQLAGARDAGYFITVQQENQSIELDPEELPVLMEACEQLLRQQVKIDT
jgi:hypothetical protein